MFLFGLSCCTIERKIEREKVNSMKFKRLMNKGKKIVVVKRKTTQEMTHRCIQMYT